MAQNPAEDEMDLQIVRAPEAFDRFFHREFPNMVAVAYAISGSRWAAEELAQEALLRAYRRWDKISTYDKPGAWLRRVTINLANSFVRRRISEAKALRRSAFAKVDPVEPHSPEDEAFWAAVRSLPRRQRETVVLHYVEDMSSADISEVLDISESSVRTHLQRGRETLVRKVESGGA